jgi:hypothetical protein
MKLRADERFRHTKGGVAMSNRVDTERNGKRWWLVLLIIPLIGTLWPPFYAHYTPTFLDVPFFYWYQFLWVIISSAIVALVYLMVRD